MTENDRPKCQTCFHWDETDLKHRDPSYTQGTCRRYPPIPVANLRFHDRMPDIQYVWPITSGSYWCGEHRPSRQLDESLDGNNELFPRVIEALKAHGIATIGDLVKLSEGQLLEVRNIGVTSLWDVRAMLARRKLRLLGDTDEQFIRASHLAKIKGDVP